MKGTISWLFLEQLFQLQQSFLEEKYTTEEQPITIFLVS